MTSSRDPVRQEQMLARQLLRYEVRFTPDFWEFFGDKVEPLLPETPMLVDVGCGPGLYLRDVSRRLPAAKLHGYDVSPPMIGNARDLGYAGEPPVLGVQDVAAEPLPLADGSVDLLSATAMVFGMQDPFPFLEEVRRVLAPNGHFLLYDWIRVPMRDYIRMRQEEPGDDPPDRYPRALEMFHLHNKYTADDWRWVLSQAKLDIVVAASPIPRARAWLTRDST